MKECWARGCGTLAPADGAGALGPGREVEVGQLADGGTLARLAGTLARLAGPRDGRLGEIEAEREADLELVHDADEFVGRAARVGAHQDLHAQAGSGNCSSAWYSTAM